MTFFAAGIGLACFYSCQKSGLSPYSVDAPSASNQGNNNTPPDTTPSFKASVNHSSIITFTPNKTIVGSNTYLKGTSTYYTVTLVFPSSTGPSGPYNIGFPSTRISATVVNGATTYVNDKNFSFGGSLTIDSISSKGKYYGSFQFYAGDSNNITNNVSVSSGTFYHL